MRFLEALPHNPIPAIMLIILIVTVLASGIEIISKKRKNKNYENKNE